MYILITGAAGSGTSTLSAALAKEIGSTWLDTDDYFWLPSDPPHRQKRDKKERGAEILKDLASSENAVVAGSVMEWGEQIETAFDLVVFLYLQTDIRLARIQQREEQRFGKVDPAFLNWAAQYDAGTAEGRSLARQRLWLSHCKCPVLYLEGDHTVEERLTQVLQKLAELRK